MNNPSLRRRTAGTTISRTSRFPAGLELNRDGSFIYESERLKAGLLGFKTQGSVTELVNYFQKNMLKDGWSLLSSFKYNKNILIYTKPDKVCLISVALPTNVEGARVEVWVAPLQSQSASQKTMRPFFKKKSPAGGQAAPGPKEETLSQ